MKRTSLYWKGFFLYALIVLGVLCCTTLTACGDDDEPGKPEEELPGGGGTTDEDGDGEADPSVYNTDMFVGVWIMTQMSDNQGNMDVYDEEYRKRIEYSMMFESDLKHGSYRTFFNDQLDRSDFKWNLGSGKKLHIVELESGAQYDLEVTFMDNNTCMELAETEGEVRHYYTYYKKGYVPF